HDIMSLLYPIHENESAPMFAHRIEQSSQIFGILMCGFIAISTTYVFGTLLTANGNLKYLNLIAAGGMFLNILLNLILIPRMFATGAAITSLITQGITAFLQVMLTQYIFRFKINYVYLLRLVVFILGAVLIGWILSKTGLWWVKSLLLTGVLILLLSAVLKLMNIKSFINILRG
ncbi:MAG: polysaccharide biosynthesis C-terminal domain-containing protein, partial [Bacteroidales bacterium]|nr:polysaccharide biosynthesis C-terminal domain-containing protein [Bacteroidales bacterium]